MIVCSWCGYSTPAGASCATCGHAPEELWRFYRVRRFGVPLTVSPPPWTVGQQGPQGDPGPAGPQGITGPAGPQGVTGDAGPVGVQGLTGTTGPAGVQGPSGAAGTQGPAGTQGATGTTGAQGPPGAQGAAGAAGAQGLQGIQGLPGSAGAQGPPGVAPVPVYAVLANGATAMTLGTNDVVKVTPTANATYTTTVPTAGTRKVILILTSGTTSRAITFGSGFKPVGTLATGTVTARVFALEWISDGASLYETSRTVAIVA